MSGNVFEFPGYITHGAAGADVKKPPESTNDPRHLSHDDFLLLLKAMSSAGKNGPIPESAKEHGAYIDDLFRYYGVINRPVDTAAEPVHNPLMNDITREEFNAKLETIEVKMDARIESVSAKIDGFLSAQSERDKRLEAALSQIDANQTETKNSLSSMKTAMLVTAVSTVLAIVFGIASFNTALTSNMMAAFQVGLSKSEQPSAKVQVPATQSESQTSHPTSNK